MSAGWPNWVISSPIGPDSGARRPAPPQSPRSWAHADDLHLVALEEAEYEPVMLFLNHSCEPNVGFAGNVVLMAMRDVAASEELTTDYTFFDDYDGAMRCHWQRPDLQQQYGPYFSWYLRRRFDPTVGGG